MALSYVIWKGDMRSPWAKKMCECCHLLPKIEHRDIKKIVIKIGAGELTLTWQVASSNASLDRFLDGGRGSHWGLD